MYVYAYIHIYICMGAWLYDGRCMLVEQHHNVQTLPLKPRPFNLCLLKSISCTGAACACRPQTLNTVPETRSPGA